MKKLFPLIFLIFILGCSSNTVYFPDHDLTINIELAKTDEQKTKGLMFRETLKENQGMLFIFEEEKQRSFWMKNTLIPLDIIFIDSNFNIINIEEAVPCEEDPCQSYKSLKPAKYVLEINKGVSKQNNIQPGEKIIFQE